jgi:hypothetical protein
MKKRYALLLSVIMIVAMSLSTFADSPKDRKKESSSTVTVEQPKAAVPAPAAPSAAEKAATEAASAATVAVADVAAEVLPGGFMDHAADLLNNKDDFLTTYDIPSNAKVAAAFDLKFDGEIPEGGLLIPIVVNNANPGDYVIVMHRRADGIWEVVGRGFLGEDLTIVGTFTSFSPVMVLVSEAAEVVAVGIRAPKTGE